MPKVLIADALSPRAVEIFTRRGIETDTRTGLTPDELAGIVGEYDGLVVRSSTKAPRSIIQAGERLKVIGRAGIGVDTIDVQAATEAGIAVMNTPFGNSITTAEHAIALMVSLARWIPQADRSTRAGKWERTRFTGVELTGKVLGIVGCGNIGAIVADRAQGLRMKAIAYDPFLSNDRAAQLNLEKVELDELLARADFITLHTPLTNETRNLLDARAFAKVKPGVRLINCARGGLIVEADLKAALESGQVAAAAIDVFEVEPARENLLFGLDNVIVTPHLGASTTEAQENVALQIAEQIADFLLDGTVTNAVNLPSVSAEEAPRLAPYLKLGQLLGSLAGQIVQSGIRGVTIEYRGEAASLNVKPVTAATLAGLLARALDGVNQVSAPVVARERDIELSEIRREQAEDYLTEIKLTVDTDDGLHVVAGTLIHGAKPRLTGIQGIPLEAELGRHMLYVRNLDKPGFVGNLGQLLGDAGINIATFHLGRAEAGGDAILLTEIDQPVTIEALGRVRRLPNVVEVRNLQF
jgi:D-3-phosphoglycerate dehydrogenase